MDKKEPVRIAHIVGKWIGGGVESIIMNYYRNIDRKKIQFDFFCDNDSTDIPYEEIEELGGRVILIPPYQSVFKYHKELKKKLQEGNYKIIHSHINTLSVFPLFAAKRAKIPTRIAHSHSTTNKKEYKRNLMKQVLRPFSKIFATDYMCCSHLAGRWLFGNKTYNKGKVYLLNNAIDIEKFKYDESLREKKRKELKINKNTLVIGHIGRFVPAKNHLFLIEIFNEIHKKEKDSVLLLAGQGPLLNKVKEKVEQMNLSKSVLFLGQQKDVHELYQAFDVFLFPSLYEGLGMVAIEAQTSGCICLASKEVPKEVKIIPNLDFLSLENSPNEWANKTLNLIKKNKRKSYTKEAETYGYNIKKEVKHLENLYIKLDKNSGDRYE